MRAALLVEPGKIVVDEVADIDPGPGEVRIAVGGVGLCGSDLSVFGGHWQAPSYPWIMGHEAFGVIDLLGSDIPPDRLGQTVVVEPNLACLACDRCRQGWTSSCRYRQSVGMNRPGALAEYVVVPSQFAWATPDMTARDLVCIEPMTVVMTALRRLRMPLPERSLVVGVGAQGLMMTVALIARGVSVQAHDVNPDRVAFAAELGAYPAEEAGERFHLVVDTVGSPASMSISLQSVEVGGTVMCLGLDSRPIGLTAQELVRGQVTLQGSLTYDHPDDFEATILHVSAERPGPGRIVTDEYALEKAQEAFEESGSARGKTMISLTSGMN